MTKGKIKPSKLVQGIESYPNPTELISRMSELDDIDQSTKIIKQIVYETDTPQQNGNLFHLNQVLEAKRIYGPEKIKIEWDISTPKKNTAIDIVTPNAYNEVKCWTTQSFIEREQQLLKQMGKYFIDAAKNGKEVNLVSHNPIPKGIAEKLVRQAKSYGVKFRIIDSIR